MPVEKGLRVLLGLTLAVLVAMCWGCGRTEKLPVATTPQDARDEMALKRCQAMTPLLPAVGQIEGLEGPAGVNCYVQSDLPTILTEELAVTVADFGAIGIFRTKYHSGPDELEVDLYEFPDSIRAEGVYLWLTPNDAPAVEVGNQGSLGKTTLRSWKGEHYLEVRGAMAKDDVKKKAEVLAGKIMEKVTPAGAPASAVAAFKKVLVDPAPSDVKIVCADSELRNASVNIPYYSGEDLLSLERKSYGGEHPVEVALAAVGLSEATAGRTVFFVARYPSAQAAVEALRAYRTGAETDKNPQMKEAIIMQNENVLAGVWRPSAGAEALLKNIMDEVKTGKE